MVSGDNSQTSTRPLVLPQVIDIGADPRCSRTPPPKTWPLAAAQSWCPYGLRQVTHISLALQSQHGLQTSTCYWATQTTDIQMTFNANAGHRYQHRPSCGRVMCHTWPLVAVQPEHHHSLRSTCSSLPLSLQFHLFPHSSCVFLQAGPACAKCMWFNIE